MSFVSVVTQNGTKKLNRHEKVESFDPPII